MNDARLIEAYRRTVVPTPETEDAILARLLAAPRPQRTTWLVGATALLAAAALVLWIAGLFTTGVEQTASTPDQAVHEREPIREPAPSYATPASLPSTPVARSSAPPPAPAPSPRPRAKPEAQPAITSDIAEEARLVAAAQAALRDRDPARALATLEEHARSFPDGEMKRDRDALRVIAECDRGHAVEHSSRAKELLHEPALAAYASRIRHACDL